jgi:hypothetical protein
MFYPLNSTVTSRPGILNHLEPNIVGRMHGEESREQILRNPDD